MPRASAGAAPPERAALHWYLRLARHHLGRGPYLDVAGAGGVLLAGLARLGPGSGPARPARRVAIYLS